VKICGAADDRSCFWPESRTAQANVRLCEAGLGRSSHGPSASDQSHNPDYEEQKEKNLGDSSGRAGDAAKTEHPPRRSRSPEISVTNESIVLPIPLAFAGPRIRGWMCVRMYDDMSPKIIDRNADGYVSAWRCSLTSRAAAHLAHVNGALQALPQFRRVVGTALVARLRI
jgi:hypothetical protein